jgi:prepilin-type N-terminal cleavage/methylation domain-containing protein
MAAMLNRRRREQAGFTLMELMVVIVIVAILAAVAVPLYINYVNDARRTEAKGAIGAVITAEQVYYQQNGASGYTPDMTKLNVDLGQDVLNKWGIGVTAASNTGFTITATQVLPEGDNGTPLVVTYQYDRANGLSKWTP